MTSDSTFLEELEAALLRDPFNGELRLDYANRLLDAGRVDDASSQFELALRADADSPDAVIGLALCQHRSGNDSDAISTYQRARKLNGFGPNAELETLLSAAQSTGPKLSVIDGGGSVVSMPLAAQSDIKFDDVAGMADLKKTLRLQIIEPFRNPGLFQRFKKKSGGGVLLYGPPGCGKTLMARAIAGECKAEFQTIGISDILNMWIGESERNLAAVFEQARSRKPCVLFFDELDALAYSRSKAASSSARTIVNEFLAQLDGFNTDNEGVLVLAATNMPWDVDSAMKRPGRFSRQVFVPPPDAAARAEMIRMHLADIPVDNLHVDAVAAATEYFSGADIDGLIDLAKESVLADILSSESERALQQQDIMDALELVVPSTMDWLKTARNLVKFSGSDASYKPVEKYLKGIKRF
ncbi:MAG: AAA family ATPase [Pseudomonadota bacterium]